jgi:hypothetical protein
MKGFTPTPESNGFSHDLLWSGLRSGCRATKSHRSRSESAKLSGATGLPAVFLEGLPWGSTGVTDNDWFECVTLLKQVGPRAQGLRHKVQGNKISWAKARMGEWKMLAISSECKYAFLTERK